MRAHARSQMAFIGERPDKTILAPERGSHIRRFNPSQMETEVNDNTPRVEQFFSGLFVECWRNVMPDEVTEQEADFLQQQLRLVPGPACWTCPAARAGTPAPWRRATIR
jgi:hypothetical protein